MCPRIIDFLRGAHKSYRSDEDHSLTENDEHKAGNMTVPASRDGHAGLRAEADAKARKRSNRSTIKPKAMTVIEVRTQAGNVRSFAA